MSVSWGDTVSLLQRCGEVLNENIALAACDGVARIGEADTASCGVLMADLLDCSSLLCRHNLMFVGVCSDIQAGHPPSTLPRADPSSPSAPHHRISYLESELTTANDTLLCTDAVLTHLQTQITTHFSNEEAAVTSLLSADSSLQRVEAMLAEMPEGKEGPSSSDPINALQMRVAELEDDLEARHEVARKLLRVKNGVAEERDAALAELETVKAALSGEGGGGGDGGGIDPAATRIAALEAEVTSLHEALRTDLVAEDATEVARLREQAALTPSLQAELQSAQTDLEEMTSQIDLLRNQISTEQASLKQLTMQTTEDGRLHEEETAQLREEVEGIQKELSEEKEASELRISELQKELGEVEVGDDSEVLQLRGELKGLQEELSVKQHRVEEMQIELSQTTEDGRLREEEMAQLREEVEGMQKELSEEKEASELRISELQKELHGAEEAAALQKELADGDAQSEEQLVQLRGELKGLQEELNVKQHRVEEMQAELSQTTEDGRLHAEETAQLREEVETLQNELSEEKEASEVRVAELQKELHGAEEGDDSEVVQLRGELKGLQEELSVEQEASRKRISSLEAEVSQTGEDAAELHDTTITQLRAEVEGLQKQLSTEQETSRQRITSLEAEVSQTEGTPELHDTLTQLRTEVEGLQKQLDAVHEIAEARSVHIATAERDILVQEEGAARSRLSEEGSHAMCNASLHFLNVSLGCADLNTTLHRKLSQGSAQTKGEHTEPRNLQERITQLEAAATISSSECDALRVSNDLLRSAEYSNKERILQLQNELSSGEESNTALQDEIEDLQASLEVAEAESSLIGETSTKQRVVLQSQSVALAAPLQCKEDVISEVSAAESTESKSRTERTALQRRNRALLQKVQDLEGEVQDLQDALRVAELPVALATRMQMTQTEDMNTTTAPSISSIPVTTRAGSARSEVSTRSRRVVSEAASTLRHEGEDEEIVSLRDRASQLEVKVAKLREANKTLLAKLKTQQDAAEEQIQESCRKLEKDLEGAHEKQRMLRERLLQAERRVRRGGDSTSVTSSVAQSSLDRSESTDIKKMQQELSRLRQENRALLQRQLAGTKGDPSVTTVQDSVSLEPSIRSDAKMGVELARVRAENKTLHQKLQQLRQQLRQLEETSAAIATASETTPSDVRQAPPPPPADAVRRTTTNPRRVGTRTPRSAATTEGTAQYTDEKLRTRLRREPATPSVASTATDDTHVLMEEISYLKGRLRAAIVDEMEVSEMQKRNDVLVEDVATLKAQLREYRLREVEANTASHSPQRSHRETRPLKRQIAQLERELQPLRLERSVCWFFAATYKQNTTLRKAFTTWCIWSHARVVTNAHHRAKAVLRQAKLSEQRSQTNQAALLQRTQRTRMLTRHFIRWGKICAHRQSLSRLEAPQGNQLSLRQRRGLVLKVFRVCHVGLTKGWLRHWWFRWVSRVSNHHTASPDRTSGVEAAAAAAAAAAVEKWGQSSGASTVLQQQQRAVQLEADLQQATLRTGELQEELHQERSRSRSRSRSHSRSRTTRSESPSQDRLDKMAHLLHEMATELDGTRNYITPPASPRTGRYLQSRACSRRRCGVTPSHPKGSVSVHTLQPNGASGPIHGGPSFRAPARVAVAPTYGNASPKWSQ